MKIRIVKNNFIELYLTVKIVLEELSITHMIMVLSVHKFSLKYFALPLLEVFVFAQKLITSYGSSF